MVPIGELLLSSAHHDIPYQRNYHGALSSALNQSIEAFVDWVNREAGSSGLPDQVVAEEPHGGIGHFRDHRHGQVEPDQKMWRVDRTTDYGALQDAARGRVDLARIERQWEDILRIIGSIHTGAVRAYDVTGALGLVLNAVVLFNTRYMDATVTQLRADGFDIRDEDIARLSPFVRHHINI
ncbi:mobile element protein [Streptomyces sp. L-9-10]|nr:mobile element protein [Streptomyces sp. L-9-10]